METNTSVGRPRIPLLIGQRTYAEFAYRYRIKTQLDIAARIRAALPRVQRFLVERGLHNPPRHGTAAHTQAVSYAVELYIRGHSIKSILRDADIPVSELYKALHARNIPLRTNKKSKDI